MPPVPTASPVLARVYRGSRVESAHRGSAAVVDARGRRLAECGDADADVYTRSTAKPFQAIPLLLAGGEKAFRLGDAELALMCASHGGEPRHVAVAAKLLRRGGFGIADLECGAHLPMHGPSARELIRKSATPTPLHHNCSGKHAGILLACRLLGHPTVGYSDPSHPLQRRIRSLVAYYADVPESALTTAVDGCNLPVFRLPLSALAAAYARLLAERLPGEERAAAAARARLVRAMVRRPEMVAGASRFTTDFLAAGRGRWIGKEGAEGVYAVGLRPEGRGGAAVGVAFKVEDGSARPRDAVTLALLSRIGALPDDARRALSDYAEPTVLNARGLAVGRIEADAPLRGALPLRRRRGARRRASG
jgi:L-asparaginase II